MNNRANTLNVNRILLGINFPVKSTFPLFSFHLRLDLQLRQHQPGCFSPLEVLKLISDEMRLLKRTVLPRLTSEQLQGARAMSDADGVDGTET